MVIRQTPDNGRELSRSPRPSDRRFVYKTSPISGSHVRTHRESRWPLRRYDPSALCGPDDHDACRGRREADFSGAGEADACVAIAQAAPGEAPRSAASAQTNFQLVSRELGSEAMSSRDDILASILVNLPRVDRPLPHVPLFDGISGLQLRSRGGRGASKSAGPPLSADGGLHWEANSSRSLSHSISRSAAARSEHRADLWRLRSLPAPEKLLACKFQSLCGYSRNESAASQRSSTFRVRRSSARVRPRLTAAIGIPRRAAIWAKRKPE
jgi:hypothetical protein